MMMYKRIIPILMALLVSVFATFGQSLLWKVSGKKMKAWFEEKELRRLDVDGNVQVIMFP